MIEGSRAPREKFRARGFSGEEIENYCQNIVSSSNFLLHMLKNIQIFQFCLLRLLRDWGGGILGLPSFILDTPLLPAFKLPLSSLFILLLLYRKQGGSLYDRITASPKRNVQQVKNTISKMHPCYSFSLYRYNFSDLIQFIYYT